MSVSEESHRGIVPMNHSNKDGASSAESEEGRLRLKENLSHLTHTRLSAGLRVSHGWASVRTSDTLAAIHLREEPDALISARPGLYGGQPAMVVPTVMCAGLNRHEAEEEEASQERSSDPLGLESCAATARDPAKRR